MPIKICTVCKTSKDIAEFPFRNKEKGKHHSYCLSCGRKSVRKHYQKNIECYVKKAAERRKKIINELNEKLYEYLELHPCVDCGEKDPIVLEFDHVRGEKLYTIASLGWRLCTWEGMLNEIAKCEVRCANCHRRRTAESLNWFRFRKIAGR